MRITCPNCGATVTADNINMQKLAAVCPECHTVFKFDLPDEDAKAKRRKVKQPDNLALQDDDTRLTMTFRTNWRLNQNADFINATALTTMFFFLTIAATRTLGPSPMLITLFLTLFFAYVVGLIAYNHTAVEMTDEAVRVRRAPLTNPLRQPTTIDLHGVEHITYEETAASVENQYDLPRFHVWAVTVNGGRKRIATDLIEEYAVFISQRLNERLHAIADIDTNRLVEADDDTAEDAVSLSELTNAQTRSEERL